MSSERINLPAAIEFRELGMDALDHLILDEVPAKQMLLANAVLGQNALLIGAPGGGKTTVSEGFHRMFSDMSSDRIATIPAMPDLRAEQLVGAEAVARTISKRNGTSSEETKVVTIEPLVRGDAQMLYADEINRTNPYALDAVLGALATNTRRLVTTAGTVKLNDLEFAIATMNPAASNQATFHLDPAVASRFAMGSVLGGDKSDRAARRDRISKIGGSGRWAPSPEKIEAFTDTAALRSLRVDAERVYIPQNLVPRYADVCINAIDAMADFGRHNLINESDGRFSDQVSRLAGALSLLGGQVVVQEADINAAVGYAITSRIGGLTRSTHGEIQDVVNQVTA